jgi:hypothetical protein
MSEQIFEIEAASLEEAREQVESQIPEGFYLLSEKVILDGKPKTVKAVADTIEAALIKAQGDIPANATILYDYIKAKYKYPPLGSILDSRWDGVGTWRS